MAKLKGLYRFSGIGNTGTGNRIDDAAQAILAARAAEAIANGNFIMSDREAYYDAQLANVLFNDGAVRIGNPLVIYQIAQQLTQNSNGQQGFSLSTLTSVFSSNGVSPSFFAGFGSVFSLLDNSSGKWKSRSQKMKSWTANQRIAWYIDALNKSTNTTGCYQYGIQYSEMYGTRGAQPKGGCQSCGQIDDRHAISKQMAEMFNTALILRCGCQSKAPSADCSTADKVATTGYGMADILCDVNMAGTGADTTGLGDNVTGDSALGLIDPDTGYKNGIDKTVKDNSTTTTLITVAVIAVGGYLLFIKK